MSDYILWLEKIFRQAYGQGNMGLETQKKLLFAQLQEGLQYTLMKAPSASGACDYSELCVAARNEERRLLELSKRHRYLRDPTSPYKSPMLVQDETSYKTGIIPVVSQHYNFPTRQCRGRHIGGQGGLKLPTLTSGGFSPHISQYTS